MKQIRLLIYIILISQSTIGQISSDDIKLISIVYDGSISKQISKKQQIIYIDKTSTGEKLITKIKEKKIFKNYSNTDSLILTDIEQDYIIEQIKFNYDFIWPDSLFENSKRVNRDNMYTYMNFNNRPNKTKYGYTFSKAYLFRNNTIALIGFSKMCGGDCGIVETGFYKKNRGHWKKWIVISSGVF